MIGRRALQSEEAQPAATRQVKLKGFDDFALSLGDVMRAERATMGKSLLDVQAALKIKISHITAIENVDPHAFDVPAFIPGYIRSYARYLGLDPEWALTKFCEEGNHRFEHCPGAPGELSRKRELIKRGNRKSDPFKSPSTPFVPESESYLSKLDPPALFSSVVLGTLILAIGYGGWTILQELQRVQFIREDQVADVSVAVEPLAFSQSLDSPGTNDVAASGPRGEELDRLYRPPPALEVPVVIPRDPAIVTLDPEQAGTFAEFKVPGGGVPDSPSLENNEVIQPSPPAHVTVRDVEEKVRDLVLLAVRPSWVRIRSDDGSVLLEKILDGGERYIVPRTEQPPILRTGNAGSVYFLVDEEIYGPLGEGPTVVDDIIMGPDEVVSSFPVANPAGDSQLAEFAVLASVLETSPDASH
ncbi:MAG: DUF4115 domain-containing protein [Rhodobacter sp.]|nr:DUF4115 domain-containing protein [Rhodobacter sp.]